MFFIKLHKIVFTTFLLHLRLSSSISLLAFVAISLSLHYLKTKQQYVNNRNCGFFYVLAILTFDAKKKNPDRPKFSVSRAALKINIKFASDLTRMACDNFCMVFLNLNFA